MLNKSLGTKNNFLKYVMNLMYLNIRVIQILLQSKQFIIHVTYNLRTVNSFFMKYNDI